MPLTVFSLSSLADLDYGKVGSVFDKLVSQIVADCKERPGDDRPRKLTFQVEIKPIAEAGECDDVEIRIKIKSIVPERMTRPYVMAVARGSSELRFNVESPDNPDQTTMDFTEEGSKSQ